MARLHIRNPRPNTEGHWTAPCGYWARAGYGMTVKDPKLVTCPTCRKMMEEKTTRGNIYG